VLEQPDRTAVNPYLQALLIYLAACAIIVAPTLRRYE
jgi:hypothetical protein